MSHHSFEKSNSLLALCIQLILDRHFENAEYLLASITSGTYVQETLNRFLYRIEDRFAGELQHSDIDFNSDHSANHLTISFTILGAAIRAGNLVLVKRLLDAMHMNPNATCFQFYLSDTQIELNALHFALYEHQYGIFEFLINHYRANLESQDSQGNTLLHAALDVHPIEQWFIAIGGAKIYQHEQSSLVLLSILERMKQCHIDLKTQVCSKNVRGITPSHLAAQIKNTAPLEVLLQHGAEANDPDNFKNNPLMNAIEVGHLEAVRCLLQASPAAHTTKDCRQRTSLFLAVEINNLDVIRCLLDSGAEVNTKDQDEKTPWDLAVRYYPDTIESIELLMQYGAVANLSNESLASTGLHSRRYRAIETQGEASAAERADLLRQYEQELRRFCEDVIAKRQNAISEYSAVRSLGPR